MTARANAGDAGSLSNGEDDRVSRRIEVRYRLAQLLTLEKFDEALSEALLARKQDEILARDLEFVMEIVTAAERRGGARVGSARPSIGS